VTSKVNVVEKCFNLMLICSTKRLLGSFYTRMRLVHTRSSPILVFALELWSTCSSIGAVVRAALVVHEVLGVVDCVMHVVPGMVV
jgi:hypothetical protein